MFNDLSYKGKSDEAWMRNLVPFAVVGSNSIIEVMTRRPMMRRMRTVMMMMMTMGMRMIVMYTIQDANGRKSRGRSYPWGTVNIEERQHCDFQVEKPFFIIIIMAIVLNCNIIIKTSSKIQNN